jgi:hypothetical protein
VRVGDRYLLLDIETGNEATTETSAEGYRLWYRIKLPDGDAAWVRAVHVDNAATGADARASAVRFDLLLADRIR